MSQDQGETQPHPEEVILPEDIVALGGAISVAAALMAEVDPATGLDKLTVIATGGTEDEFYTNVGLMLEKCAVVAPGFLGAKEDDLGAKFVKLVGDLSNQSAPARMDLIAAALLGDPHYDLVSIEAATEGVVYVDSDELGFHLIIDKATPRQHGAKG